MKNDVIHRKMAKGAATTLAAATLVMPQHQTVTPPQKLADDVANIIAKCEVHDASGSQLDCQIKVPMPPPSGWDDHLEKEFRKLALLEATGKLNDDGAARLDQLNRWRDETLNPPSTEEVLLQLKRDRILSKMENLLREYVEFEESTRQARSRS